MQIIIADDYKEMSERAGEIVAEKIKKNPKLVLGLATGSTPLGLYQFLADLHGKEQLDFSQITTFNLDEYAGLGESNEQSYRYFMEKNLFLKINIKPENIFFPEASDEGCQAYEQKIKQIGGIDLQILGIGGNGHIGFNEPGSSFDSRTRIVDLTPATIKDNSRFFPSVDQVPKKAVSMGIATIMEAKEIILLASGENKNQAIFKALKGEISEQVPASALQKHRNLVVILDKEAGKLV